MTFLFVYCFLFVNYSVADLGFVKGGFTNVKIV